MIAARGLSPDERLSEIGTLLAGAVTRLLSRKSSAFDASLGESSLHILLDQSVAADPVKGGERV
jgi:hypothetical protein